ncbi:MAG: hypothetical protein FWG87_13125 [Defluviitaleaceae bacterium]|nr:hypothetical protein [Defluviitaleaceae bacterium]
MRNLNVYIKRGFGGFTRITRIGSWGNLRESAPYNNRYNNRTNDKTCISFVGDEF